MNIIFLIGNGFDLNLGMKTRYHDFYEYYTSQRSPSELVKRMKEDIDKNIENWSDLELALGDYTKNLESSDEFNEVFEDLEDNLGDYLKEVEDSFDFKPFNVNKLYKFLASPENALPAADRLKIVEFKKQWSNHQWNIYLITFNYTRSLEKLLKYDEKEIRINELLKMSHPVLLNKIEHVHGFHDARMVMGVNDLSQISNENFHKDSDVLVNLVKNDCNQAQKHTLDNWCKSQIQIADLICIFGSSIGDTDNQWWKLIGERLKHNCRLIIFEKWKPIPPRRQQIASTIERNKKKYFLDKTNLTDKEKESVSGKIIIGINTNMFDIR